jgi:hypothetical protein
LQKDRVGYLKFSNNRKEFSWGCVEEDHYIDDFAVFLKGEALSDADIAEVRSRLEVLAQNVSFVRGGMPRHTPAVAQVYNEPITTGGSQIGATFEGRRSHVIIPRCFSNR